MGESPVEEQLFSLQATIEYVNSLEKTINDLSIYPRRQDFYPFETVAGEMIAKSFALSRSAILLVCKGVYSPRSAASMPSWMAPHSHPILALFSSSRCSSRRSPSHTTSLALQNRPD